MSVASRGSKSLAAVLLTMVCFIPAAWAAPHRRSRIGRPAESRQQQSGRRTRASETAPAEDALEAGSQAEPFELEDQFKQ